MSEDRTPEEHEAPVGTWGLATDVGRVRAHNEDSALAREDVFVVADGMGGHAAGEVASGLATSIIAELVGRPRRTQADVVEQVEEANRRIVAASLEDAEKFGMGTTVTGLAVVDVDGETRWTVFNVGDSRVYHLVDGSLTQLTRDHSEVQELVDLGRLTLAQAARYPRRNMLTRTLGRAPMPTPDTWVLEPVPGERFLLCSDGLTNELDTEQITALLQEHPDAQEAAEVLVERAVAAGGRDNVTVVVVNGAD